MRREEYILSVKAKLDEISPFDEPNGFIASDGDPDYEDVKPITSYIDECLDKATWYCLNNLPLTLLAKDIQKWETNASIDKIGVGHIINIDEYWRLIRLHTDMWERDVTAFISTSDPIYLLQQNAHTRGGRCKPIVAYSPETAELELYSYSRTCCCGNLNIPAILYYIDCQIPAEQVQSAIADFITLVCASYVDEILGNIDASKIFMEKYEMKVTTILH